MTTINPDPPDRDASVPPAVTIKQEEVTIDGVPTAQFVVEEGGVAYAVEPTYDGAILMAQATFGEDVAITRDDGTVVTPPATTPPPNTTPAPTTTPPPSS